MARDRASNLGSIPACAGEPERQTAPQNYMRVHPRVCGGAPVSFAAADLLKGPSPRVRGSHRIAKVRSVNPGSIPACAGEPVHIMLCHPEHRVHPRVCGGALERRLLQALCWGPSPRVRGSLTSVDDYPIFGWSIPACAGEPDWIRPLFSAHRVHPRVCGGAPIKNAPVESITGPSPRVRGSQMQLPQRQIHGGSIPACAGEPPICDEGNRS